MTKQTSSSRSNRFNAQAASPDAQWRKDLGCVTLARFRRPVGRFKCWNIGGDAAATMLIAHIQLRGSSLVSQLDRYAKLSQHDMTFVLTSSSYQVELSEGGDVALVALRVDRQKASEQWLAERSATAISGHAPGVQMLRDFVMSLCRHGDRAGGGDADTSALLESVALNLLSNALCPVGRWHVSEQSDSTHSRVLEQVESRLFDPDLRTASIARALGVTTRTVQGVFAQMATTPTQYILQRRLSLSAQKLKDAKTFSVAEMALQLGFTDASYFARRFKKCFGMTPSQYRATQLARADAA